MCVFQKEKKLGEGHRRLVEDYCTITNERG